MTMLLCPPGVYRAQSDTEMLAETVRVRGHASGCTVLDIGTGSGAVALAAARAGARSVDAVDMSWRSVATTWVNCRLRAARVSVHRGDLFAPVAGRRFDLIVANPPYVPAETAELPRHRIARCWDAGLDGRAVLDRICDHARRHLNQDGVLLLVHSGVCGAESTVDRLAGAGMTGSVIERAQVPFGPVMHARAALLVERGLIEPGTTQEELVVIEARRAG